MTIEELQAKVASLEETNKALFELTFIQRDINEKNKATLSYLIELFETLPVQPETQKFIKKIAGQFKRMIYTKV